MRGLLDAKLVSDFFVACVMNVISFEKAYSLYPKATFEERSSLVCATSDGPRQEPAMKKYEQRGWKMVVCGQDEEIQSHFHCDEELEKYRWMGDAHCWTIHLDIANIHDRLHPNDDSPRLLHDPVVAASWLLGYIPGIGGLTMFDLLTEDKILLLGYVYLDLPARASALLNAVKSSRDPKKVTQ